jgi:hypothetical protein
MKRSPMGRAAGYVVPGLAMAVVGTAAYEFGRDVVGTSVAMQMHAEARPDDTLRHLPRGVLRDLGSAVLVAENIPKTYHYSKSGQLRAVDDIQKFTGSGVIVDATPHKPGGIGILTAAHVIGETNADCSDQNITFQRRTRIPLAVGPLRESRADPSPSSDWDKSYNNMNDAAFIVPHGNQTKLEAATRKSRVPVQSTISVHQSEQVYSINYQPTPYGTYRDPHANNPAEREPAVYSGTVTKEVEDGYFEMLVGAGKSFGRISDKDVRPGASGGEVVNGKGRLLGLTVARQLVSSDYLSWVEDIDGLPSDRTYELATVKAVDARLVSTMFNDALSSPVCDVQAERRVVDVNYLLPESTTNGRPGDSAACSAIL